MEEKSTVGKPSKAYNVMAEDWKIVRDTYGGTKAMRKAGVTYLFQEKNESNDNYSKRLKQSIFFNAIKKTIDDMAGRVFDKHVELSETAPSYLNEFKGNVDRLGTDLNNFTLAVFKDALKLGKSHILIDTPVLNGTESKADKLRPYMKHIRCEDLIGWKSEEKDGIETLTQIRIKEKDAIQTDGYEDEEVEQIRVLLPNAWEIWRKNDKDDWVLYSNGTREMAEITLVTVYTEKTGFMTAKPPLMDLAYTNIAHWQSQSDQRNILHVARIPILFGAGLSAKDKVVIGATSLTVTENPTATLNYVEHSGASISAGYTDLEKLEFQMQVQGLQLLVSDSSKTATGEIRDNAKENSRLSIMVNNLQSAMEQALGFVLDMVNEPNKEFEVILNTDFGLSARGQQDLTLLLSAVTTGQISQETFLEEMKRRNVLLPSVDIDLEVAKSKEEDIGFVDGE